MNKLKQNIIYRSLVAASFFTMCFNQASAQIATPFLPQHYWLTVAEDQFQQAHFQLAAQSAKRFLELPDDNAPVTQLAEKDKAGYYLVLSQLRTNATGCEDAAKQFIANTSNPAYKQRGSVAIARYYFLQNRYAEAIPWYTASGINNLTNNEIADKKFELAYCYFNTKQFEQAEPLFATIKEISGKYYDPGNYYYGLLSYNQNEYQNALKSFERIANLPQYKTIVPYYVAEIYYFMGDKDKALSEALRLIKRTEKQYYDNELHLLAAQCYFESQKYSEALPYFEHYYDNSDKIRKDELYELAYCYYAVKNYEQAVDDFKQLSGAQDSLGQSAMYLLGECYLKTNDRKSARNAFGICADMNYNAGQKEASLLLAGKLSYEAGYYDEAARRLNTLFSEFPASAYKTEGKTIYSDLLARTNNYKEAYSTLLDVQAGDENYARVFQKVAYGYAIQQMQTGSLQEADELLGKSLRSTADNGYTAAAYFWQSDIAYRMQHFDDAIRYGQQFVEANTNPARTVYISSTATSQHAYMNMGYACMKTDKFDEAQTYFNKAQKSTDGSADINANAVLREADAAFMRKQFSESIALYDKAIGLNPNADGDYARLQKSIILGLQNKAADKITVLQSLVNKTPPSVYAADARYELAITYIDQDKFQLAITTLQPLTQSRDIRRAPAAWLKTGFAYQELNKDENAIESYRHVVIDYPGAEERTAALDALKSLYIQNNKPGSYAELLKDANMPDADHISLDSTYYAAAETQYAANNFGAARDAMAQYLQKYPNGAFALKAHYYKAESHYQLKELVNALTEYDAVLAEGWNNFSENSAKKAAVISFQNGNYSNAYKYYGLLRNNALSPENLTIAYSGMMQSSFYMTKYAEASAYADTLITLPNIDEATKTQANFYKAKALVKQNNPEAALAIFQQLTFEKNSAIAAEARYNVAAIYLLQDKLKEAEAAANQTIQQSGGNDYWVVKSYLLLADILTKQKDYFNAKATLQSIIKNTKLPELKAEATQKLEEIKKLEKTPSKLQD